MTGGASRGKPALRARAPRRRGAGDQQVSGTRSIGAKGAAAETSDTGQALARLEAAVERLAIAATRPRAPEGEGVSRAQVQAIADRLDDTIARLRTAHGEDA